LIYTLTGDDAAALSISSTGVITFNTAPNFEVKATYAITVNVSDGVNNSSQALTINITDVNDAPTFIDLASEYSVTEGNTAVVTFTIADEDTAEVTTTISGDDGAQFSLANEDGDATVDLAFTTAPDYSSPSDLGANNVYNITLTVSDGIDETAQSITITVLDSDAVPIINDSKLSINEFTKTLNMGITDPDGDAISYEIVNANKNYNITSTLGNSDGSNYILSGDITVGANETVQVLSDIQIGSSGSLTIEAGGILIGKNVDLVTGKYNRPQFSNGVTFSNTYGENIVLVSPDGQNYEESNSVGNQVIYLMNGGNFKSAGTEATRSEIRGLSIVFGATGGTDNTSAVERTTLIDINYTNWTYGTLHPNYFRRSDIQKSSWAGGLYLKNSYLNFVNSVNAMNIVRTGGAADVIIEGNVFHNSGGFKITATKDNSALLRVRNNIFFGEEVYRTGNPAFLTFENYGAFTNAGNVPQEEWQTHSDGIKKIIFSGNAFISLPGETKAISCSNFGEYLPIGPNYFGYSKDFSTNIRPFIEDSNSDLSIGCVYPDSMIATTPSRTWTIKPEFFIASGGRATMDIPLDYESTRNKTHQFTVRANTGSGNSFKSTDFTITLELQDVDD
jgi:hypothetical protein